MNGALLLLLSAVWLSVAYIVYGRYITKLFGVDPRRPTPAVTRNDGIDYVSTPWPVLFGHHFSSIAGAGPIVGPVLAAYFGWGPVVLWILVGCVFVGAFHDFAALFSSVREGGLSIGTVIERRIGYGGRQMFLLFSWAALILVVAIFTLLVANTFVATPAVATASILFIVISPVFGYLVYRRNLSISAGSMIFVPLLLFAVWLGVRHPIDLSASFMNYALERNPQFAVSDKDREAMLTAIDAETEFVLPDRERTEDALNTAREAAADMLRAGTAAKSTDAEQIRIALNLAVGAFVHTGNPTIDPLILKECAVRIQKRAFKSLTNSDKTANRTWILFLLAYGCLASILPVWLLLQPRDYLNSYLLFAMMLLGFVGILFFQPEIRIPFLAGWTAVNPAGKTDFLFPLLFVTVACGACSGFHALVASGTTSKQIRSEGHILRIGYGSMLVEGLLAVMALISVAYLPLTGYADAIRTLGPTGAFAAGLAQFTTKIGVPFDNAATFVSLAISAFMLTTLDTAMRLARFTWQELFLPRNLSKEGDAAQSVPERTGIPGLLSRPIPATAIAVALSGYLALSGNANQIWPVFGASNQLLAALTLLAITLLLIRKGKNWLTAFLPMAFMMMVSGIALIVLFVQKIKAPPEKRELLLIVATGFLIIMAATLVIRSLLSLTKGREKTSELPASNNLN